MKKGKIFIKATYAGIMIGVGGCVYLSVENRIVGSLLFSFGLLTIVTQGFWLYTGKIGFVKKIGELADMALVLAGNYIGTFLTALLVRMSGLPLDTGELVGRKLDHSIWQVFFLSVLCGVMMYLAIDNYNKSRHIIFIMLPVMIFILSGFEHSVANMFYFHLAGAWGSGPLGYLLVMVLGNGVGAKLFDLKPE